MAVQIANSGHDERGKYTGGTAGDQTGTEWEIKNWYKYSYGWSCVLRHPDAQVREEIARQATNGAKNNNFGYDQWNRLTAYNAAKDVGFELAKVKKPVEGDCSAYSTLCAICAGHKLGISALKNLNPNLTTYNMRTAFRNAGFSVLTDSKYLKSDAYLVRGDVLLNDNHHTCIVLGNGASTTQATPGSYAEPTALIQSGSKGDGVRWVQTMLNKFGYGLEVDGKCGYQTVSAIKDFQRKHGLTADGQVGPLTRTALKSGAATKNPYPTPTVNLKKGSKGDGVRWVQWELQRLGYSLGSYGIDGDFGSSTDSAVRAFQKKYKLTVDGIVGKNTRDKLKAV